MLRALISPENKPTQQGWNHGASFVLLACDNRETRAVSEEYHLLCDVIKRFHVYCISIQDCPNGIDLGMWWLKVACFLIV